jgi:3-deoxy-manno-octulosonate cytidylyltransferase (CMP-KDO synthetase)
MNRPIHGIIPARYASSRFPGKPLALLRAKPMFWHVWKRASLCPRLSSVTLATDDARISAAAEALSVPCLMTAKSHQSGTDRVHEAAVLLGLPEEAIVVNIQGDEPALAPGALSDLLDAFDDPAVQAATLARALTRPVDDANLVKVVLALSGNALYFSRANIPHSRPDGAPAEILGHIGLYAFGMRTLRRFVSLPPSPLERAEKLEQLRFLENELPLRVILTEHISRGVDTPEDLAEVLPLLDEASAYLQK